MKSTSGRAQWAVLLALVAMIGFLGLLMPGCAPGPEEKAVDESVPQDWPETPPGEEEAEEEEAPAEEPGPMVEEEPVAPPPAETVEPAPEPAEAAAEEPAPAAAEKPKEPPAAMPAEEKPAAEQPFEEQPAEEKPAAAAAAAAVDAAKLSTYAPAEDLARQLEEYLEDLEEAVEDEADFADEQSKLVKDANVLVLVGLAFGLHDQDSKYKQAAPALVEAAEKLAALTETSGSAEAATGEPQAADYAETKAAVEALKAAAASTGGDPSTLKWERAEAASMAELMKAVPLIHSRLKRYMRGSRFESEAETTTGLTAVIAVVAQGSMPLAAQTEQPNEVEAWHKYCAEMRDASAEVHATIVAQDEAAAEKAMEKLQKSCDDCHEIFHPGTVVE